MKSILIVDDSSEIRDLVAMTLRRAGREVFQAANAQDAIEIARKTKPDLIMMDIMMPGEMDGFQAAQVIKADEETSGCRIIFLTAKGLAADREKGFETGADDYFVKPFSPLELMRKVDSIIGE